MARLVDIENELKTLIEKDINSDDVYNKIFELVFRWLQRARKLSTETEAREVAQIAADELYIKILNNPDSVRSWLGYISIAYRAYIRVWRNLNKSELIEIGDNYELEQAVVRMSAATYTYGYYQKSLDRVYFKSIPKTVDIVLGRSRYNINTKAWLNAKLSLLLSVKSGEYVNFNQDKVDIPYTRMLYNLLKSIISNDLISCNDNEDDKYTLMKLFNVSNIEVND
jgi:hypothetical protein